ncbi:non-homologous end-joining DNA ligase [Paraflavitalea sp. CAU 1676]|uniref:non-homologous end-joining DNA ligase n=1 Tax=Paraflavitalea sp. CAU 1676 TaxID=3032598 RepID=UPI0023D9E490|nr:non-homologous end-joining DNA ligase [Paraflavitalea sp. CAU 1676]MDF2190542.1 non-homologous end-joining DNA ligase [Paraflavitalea sp. CAU 1676]
MLATITDKPFNNEEWAFEMKLDGYRIISYVEKGKVLLHSRNLKDYSARFFPISDALKKWKVNAIVDGEVVVLNSKGVSVFNDLQNWNSPADGNLYYYIFDLLWYDGDDLMNLPLRERRTKLRSIMPKSNVLLFSDEVEAKGVAFFKQARKQGLEGIIAKRQDSTYAPGDRSKDWLKVKAVVDEEMIVCGYTKNEGSPSLFSALVLGAYKRNKLVFQGQVGTGFNRNSQKDIMAKLNPLFVKKCPFPEIPNLSSTGRWGRRKVDFVQWVKPKLVCQVKFLERTPSGDLRHQSFLGLRDDKTAKEVKAF